MLRVGHDTPAIDDQFSTCRRRERPFADTLDKLEAAAGFKFPNLLADRWLRQMQSLGSLGEAAKLHDLNQRAQLVQVEAPHDKRSLS